MCGKPRWLKCEPELSQREVVDRGRHRLSGRARTYDTTEESGLTAKELAAETGINAGTPAVLVLQGEAGQAPGSTTDDQGVLIGDPVLARVWWRSAAGAGKRRESP